MQSISVMDIGSRGTAGQEPCSISTPFCGHQDGLRLLPAPAVVAVPNAVPYPSELLRFRKGLSSHHAPDLQGWWVLSWGRLVLMGEFCLSPALSIHQLAAQGELSQLKEHLRKGSCLFPWLLTPDCSTPFHNHLVLWVSRGDREQMGFYLSCL